MSNSTLPIRDVDLSRGKKPAIKGHPIYCPVTGAVIGVWGGQVVARIFPVDSSRQTHSQELG